MADKTDKPRLRFLAAIALALGVCASGVSAQGTTTATLTGSVRAASGQSDGARVRVTNRSTGYVVDAEVRRGRYFAAGLETGGPYSIEVRRIGAAPQRRDSVFLKLGEQVEIDFDLTPVATTLDTVYVVTRAGQRSVSRSRAARGGTGATIEEGVLRNMPALNRDLLDFTRLVPEVGTRFGGVSGAGVSYRLNSYLIDGASERLLNGNGMMSGAAGGKPISVEALKEYQVLLAPFDPRYGDFAGALVNAVTKSGTNEPHGSAFVYARNEEMARNTTFLRDAPYDRSQVGFSIGGPIVRNRAHFFVASEFQRFDQPSTGPFVGQDSTASDPIPVALADIDRFESLLRSYGLEPGNGERVSRPNPTSNVFARVDVVLPWWRSRAVLRHNHADVWQTFFTRPSGTPRFPLSGAAFTQRVRHWSTAMQLFTQLPGGLINELMINETRTPGRSSRYARSPLIEVFVPATAGGRATLVAGPPDNAQGTGSDQKTFEVADHLTYLAGTHGLSAGARAEFFAFNNISTRGQFGRWNFSSLDALQNGQATRFRVEKDFGSAKAVTRGSQVSLYVADSWRATDRLTINGGMRAEVLTFTNRPSYNPTIDSIFGRRTDAFPGTQVHWTPRLGFILDVEPDHGGRLRGGAGVFAGRPPLAWVAQALRFDGVGTRSLDCRGANPAPPFVPDPSDMPTTCANGVGFGNGLVNLIDPGLRMAEMFRSSLAYERVLPWDVRASIEALYTRTLTDFVFEHPNLVGPQGEGRHGRVMYGGFLNDTTSDPRLVSNSFFELIDLRNHGNGHSIALTSRVEKRFGERFEASASYTRSRVRDVQSVLTISPVLTYAFWANGRTVSGKHDDLTPGISAYEIPHRVLFAAGWTSPARRWPTAVSLYYVGEAGIPFTFTDSTPGGLGGGKGDLNADGTNSNDAMYVPRNAMDPAEITFDGTGSVPALAQRAAFEAFISRTPCLQRQRGRIMTRNSCSGPWIHTANASLRQQLPTRWSGHALSLDVEVFNALNLLNPRWGLLRVPNTVVLQHVRQDLSVTPSEPVFRYDPAKAAHSADNAESAYQIQLALRYRF